MTSEKQITGKYARVSESMLHKRRIVCEGRWLVTAKIFDEAWLDLPPLDNPDALVVGLQDSALEADVFTFSQQLPDLTPHFHTYHLEWDNIAVAPAANFKTWWDSLPQESRKNVRRSQKRGVSVHPVAFGDDLVRGINAIYNETPFRQGRRFWHYGKSFDVVKRENSSYLDRSQFIGAYWQGELIGFLKMVYSGSVARIMQILSQNRHFDKNTTNALITCAMEVCSQKPVEHLIYGQYVYGNKRNSSVTEFKRRNGFIQVLLPRYYIPLTIKGRAALAVGAHRGIHTVLPESVINFLLDTRSVVYERLLPRTQRAAESST